MSVLKMMSDGTMVDLTAPIPMAALRENVVAQELARIARYGGSLAPHVPHYSVAEHSVHCANLVRTLGRDHAVQKACFLHDAHEVITGDILGPVKRYLKVSGDDQALMRLESRTDAVVGLAWGVAFEPYREIVSRVDRMMQAIEREHLMAPGPAWPGHDRLWEMIPPGYPVPECWNIDEARTRFLAKAAELFGVRS